MDRTEETDANVFMYQGQFLIGGESGAGFLSEVTGLVP